MCEQFQALAKAKSICIIRYTKLMLIHSASRFMQRLGTNGLGCNSSILIMCVLMLTRQNMCIQPSMTFKIWFRGLSKLHVFLMGKSPALMLINITMGALARIPHTSMCTLCYLLVLRLYKIFRQMLECTPLTFFFKCKLTEAHRYWVTVKTFGTYWIPKST